MTVVAVLRSDPSAAAPAAMRPAAALVLDLARLRARRLVLWQEEVWRAGRSSPDQGLAITAGEVAWLLAGDEAARHETGFLAAHPEAAALERTIRDTEAALAADGAWATLTGSFDLDLAEADLLVLLAAAEIDPGLQRVFAYLHDDSRLTQPSAGLSRRLARRPGSVWTGEALRRWRLASPLDDPSPLALTAPWRIDPAVMTALHHGDWRDPRLAGAVNLITGADLAGTLPLHAAAQAGLAACADLREVELTGPPGIGRQTLAARHAQSCGGPLLSADVPLLLAQGLEPRDLVTLVLRQARFCRALAYFRDADAVPAAEWDLARRLGVDYLRGVRLPSAAGAEVALPPLALAERLQLWTARRSDPAPSALFTHRLTPAEVRRLADARPGETARIGGRRPDHALLSRLPCPYDWDDLVLPPDIARQLREFADQVRLRWSVYDDWGFGRLAHLGFGISALFGGPSGAGKTMAAQVIARSLGLDLYRVDLAGVVNKYIGETEKRLREVFDACEHAGALLFFDEADALFGARMQVKDAHDRFANIETNYLLQRIESFDGVAILATNRRNDIDQAFVRRLRFVIEFMAPRADERLTLWRRALPSHAPGGEPLLDDIDWRLLADRLEMTGAEIKNTVLAAAFLARAEGERIGMRHLLGAAQRELAKQRGKLPVTLREAAGA